MNVLVVSDEQNILGLLEQSLVEKKGVKALHWVGWKDSCPAVRSLHPDLVLARLPQREHSDLPDLSRMRQATSSRLAVIGPMVDSRHILKVLRAGADDYLDEERLEEELEAVLHRPVVARLADEKAGKVIAVIGCGGGCGASTLAVNLGAAFAQDAGKALLVDLKLEAGDLAALLDLLPGHTLGDLCPHADRLDANLLENAFARHESGLSLLASPRQNASIMDRLNPNSAGGHPVQPEAVARILHHASFLFPWMVIDVNPHVREEQLEALRLADVIFAVMRLDFVSLQNARRMQEHLTWLGIEERRVRFLANRTGQPKEVPQAKAEEALHGKIYHCVPDDPTTMNRATNHGIPAVLGEPRSKAARSITQLAQVLKKEG